jgi:AAA domain, putative AbiEii toxin, Type IV TA system/AAA domain
MPRLRNSPLDSRNQPPLHLSRISIKNIRCFKDLTIDLRAESGTRKWAVIFADNGVGKTTLLKCIAMGLCGESDAAGLLAEIYGDWNRSEDGVIQAAEIRLDFADGLKKASITTTFKPPLSRSKAAIRVEQETVPKAFPWDRIFVCGYGAGRAGFGTTTYSEYASVDALYSLFNYETTLQNPELMLRRIKDDKKASTLLRSPLPNGKSKRNGGFDGLLNRLADVLMLPDGAVKLDSAGVSIAPWDSEFYPINALGDGQIAAVSMVVDFLGWVLMYAPDRPLREIGGIMIIDELEHHLHPRWQREIIKRLSEMFPNVQFIVTSHTPTCAIGTTALKDDDVNLIRLERYDNQITLYEKLAIPRGKRADQILTSELFGLETSGDDATVHDIARLNSLMGRNPPSKSSATSAEAEAIRTRLSTQFETSETELETFVKQEVRRALKAQAGSDFSEEAVDFEVLRQLQELAQ